MLRFFRKMGSMEQLFTAFNEYKFDSWGCITAVSRIEGLSQIPLDKLQSLWNTLHLKFQSLQCQVLAINDVNEYDDIYIGCLPFKIIRCDEEDVNKLFVRELNYRFPILNDFNLTTQDLKNGKYDINRIAPLYRVFICNDFYVLNINHAIVDGISTFQLNADWLCLLNNDMAAFEHTTIPYMNVEQCIEPKYASSAFSRKMESLTPVKWAIKFGKFYANNSFLSKYNPLGLHHDDILRFQMYTPGKYLSLNLHSKCIDIRDWRIDSKSFTLSKEATSGFRKQCKSKNVHLSSVMQYLIIASIIECHSNILKKENYKTVVYNAFTTTPMYKKPQQKVYLGCHASAYGAIIEYYKNIKINSDRFWQLIQEIDDQILGDDMVTKVYKNKFPYMNVKKFYKDILENKMNFADISFAGGLVSNPGVMDINKPHWKHKCIEAYGGGNGMTGFGGAYILGGAMIKGIDKMIILFSYGLQYFNENTAQKIVDKLKDKMEIIASLKTNYQSKL